MLQNQPITTPLFQNSLRSWRANYLARQQAQAAEQPVAEKVEELPAEAPQAQASAPQRVKRLAPRRRKRLQAAAAGE
jgi:hypothetical protein